ncbi:unnamed protein product [Arctia plantaginis]|uniref:ABC transmembrane type-1 domain-containing protein n=1 Tax=Arctia plantaginis TaxID=874455 RepID=A0A8S0ZM44_ARCPL|nr:unnamed protein product [Arctia plantaginis]
MGAKKKNDQKNTTELNVSYFQIFRYATWLELTATILGVVFGLLSGGEKAVIYHLLRAFGGGRRLFNASYEENMAALLEDAKAIAIGMFLSIVISLFFVVLSVLLVSWSALRQITRIRMKFLRAVLRQDMSWFDTDSEFNLASKMTE